MPWKLKSESNAERVYAHTRHGEETGRYRYSFADGRTLEVGVEGLHGDSRPASNPRRKWIVAAIVAPAALLAADLALRIVG